MQPVKCHGAHSTTPSRQTWQTCIDDLASDSTVRACSFLRSSSALYNGSVIGLPVSNFIALLHYRRDVLANAGIGPPNTWQELIQAAKLINGTDMNGGERAHWQPRLFLLRQHSAGHSRL